MTDTGTLFVVATPIGNIEDLSARARDTIENASFIACEDTRRTAKLLQLHELDASQKKLHSFNLINEEKLTEQIIARLQGGDNVVLVCDAGTPLLSDPGFPLIKAAYANAINVTTTPGASAVTACISICPIPMNEFQFVGFIERRPNLKRTQLQALLAAPVPIVFFDSPKRIINTVTQIQKLGYGDREIFICRELTKLNEEKLYDTVDVVVKTLTTRENVLGEIVAVLAPNKDAVSDIAVDELLDVLKNEDLPPTTAARIMAKLTTVSRQEAYQRLTKSMKDG